MKKERQALGKIFVTCFWIIVFISAGCSNQSASDAPRAGRRTVPRAGRSLVLGTGLGALAGQAIGRDTKSTLIGAGIGAGVGYMIGNEQDKKVARNYSYDTPTPLSGTKWQVISLVMDDKPEYESLVVEFRPDGIVVTTRFETGGTKTITEEHYRIVGNALIVNRPDYLINAKYKIDGDMLILDCERFRAVLKRM